MPFKKGQSGNAAGRKKGSQNKETVQIKEAYAIIMDMLEARMKDDAIANLTPGRVAETYAALLNYKKAKLNSNINQTTLDGGIELIITRVNKADKTTEDNDVE